MNIHQKAAVLAHQYLDKYENDPDFLDHESEWWAAYRSYALLKADGHGWFTPTDVDGLTEHLLATR